MSHPTSLECEPNCDIRDVEPLDAGETGPEEEHPAAAAAPRGRPSSFQLLWGREPGALLLPCALFVPNRPKHRRQDAFPLSLKHLRSPEETFVDQNCEVFILSSEDIFLNT